MWAVYGLDLPVAVYELERDASEEAERLNELTNSTVAEYRVVKVDASPSLPVFVWTDQGASIRSAGRKRHRKALKRKGML